MRGRDLPRLLEATLDAAIRAQESKRLAVARRLVPHATSDDADQPHDLPALASDPHFNYEDGILAGLLAARAAMRASLRGDGQSGGPRESDPVGREGAG
ncbi:MAG: hypothetical protein AMXMBFR64_48490 [Myxococcales bacterium]